MLARLLCAALAASCLASCASSAPETVHDGHVRQRVTYEISPSSPPLDVLVVVAADGTPRGQTLVAHAGEAVASRLRRLARSQPSWSALTVPVDVRAVVTAAGLGPPAHRTVLTWHQDDATETSANAFADAVASAIVSAGASTATMAAPGDVALIAALDRTLRDDAGSSDARRLIVLVSSADDAGAPAVRDPFVDAQRDDLILLVPPEARSSKGAWPHLERWLQLNDGYEEGASPEARLGEVFVDYQSPCLPPEWRAPRCRVRALVPPGTSCDETRGWRRPTGAIAARPLESSIAAATVCEVSLLEGDALRACEGEDIHAARTSGASGWCLPAPGGLCRGARPEPRLVGRAAPSWATIEIACDL